MPLVPDCDISWNPAIKKMRKKRKKGLSCTWLPIPQSQSYSRSMNLPERQSNDCDKVQLKSLRALERKTDFVTTHKTTAMYQAE